MEQILLIFAIGSTAIYFLFFLLMIFGADLDGADGIDGGSNGGDGDGDLGSFFIFFKIFIGYLMGTCWAALFIIKLYAFGSVTAFMLGNVVGIPMAWLFYKLLKLVTVFDYDGTVTLDQVAIGAEATVIIAIPEKRRDVGKIEISHEKITGELLAVTDDEERIIADETVLVISVDEGTANVTKNY